MATPIRIKRSAIAGKIPTTEQLQLGELAVNFYDGKVFFKQDTQGVGIGTRIVQVGGGSTTFPGKSIYVTYNGNDENSGLDENNAKATIKSAAAIALPGDTIKVYAGSYVEDNPIVLADNVTVIGADIRNITIQPQNDSEDIIQLGQGGTIQDLSFVGVASTGSGMGVIAYRPLLGVSSDRFFDASRLIRQNLDFIAAETAEYINSTDYKNPAISIDSDSYISNIKQAYRSICHDITRGGNSKCIEVGKTYFTGDTLNSGIGVTHIDALQYSIGIARSCINNITWNGGYQTTYYQIRDLSIQADSSTGSNTDYASCANVHSAVNTCVGIITGIIQNGIDVNPPVTGFTTNYPGNDGTINSGILDSSLSPSQGVGVITKGPYIRNCTNFVENSIGIKIDGFHADEGSEINNIGVQGSVNIDAYTQYNQGGIGVSITNGSYAQLVSLFTICNDTAVYVGGGAQCDLTNSNSSFGTRGLVSQGVGGPTTKNTDRYTGEVTTTAASRQNQVIVSGVGNNRPYSGQAIYFDRLYYVVSDITITDGGSGYTSAPLVTIDDPTGPGIAIKAQASAAIQNGSVSNITLLSSGSQYTEIPSVNITGGGGNGASATATIQPIYYSVVESTVPSSGITTISLVQNLNNEVGIGTTVFFARQSFQIVSSHSFEYIGAGNTIENAYPSKGGITIQENEIVKLDGGDIAYTSTDQQGNFRIGDGVVIDQQTGAISGPDYTKSLFSQVTPFILALGGD